MRSKIFPEKNRLPGPQTHLGTATENEPYRLRTYRLRTASVWTIVNSQGAEEGTAVDTPGSKRVLETRAGARRCRLRAAMLLSCAGPAATAHL